jgi:hypothetical protein
MIDLIRNGTWKRCSKCGCTTNTSRDTCGCGGKLVVDPSASPAMPELSKKIDQLAAMVGAMDEARETLANLPPDGEMTGEEKKLKEWLVNRVASLKKKHEILLAEIRGNPG